MSRDFYQATFASSPKDMPTIGLFREAKCLVVELAHHQFPDRCLKTDMPISEPHTLVELTTYNVQDDELNLVRGVVSASTNRMLTINENNKGNNVVVPLGVPLIPAMAAKLTSPWPLIIVICSIVFTLGCFAAMMASIATENALVFISLLCGCFLGVILMIGGFVMMTMRTSRVLSIKRLADGKVWLRGAHSDWLARLPEYRISPELLQRDYKRAVSSTWWSFGTAVVFTIAALVCIPIAVKGYYKGVDSRDWPPVQGRVVNTHITSHKPRRSSRYWLVNYDFSYEVNQEGYQGKSSVRENSPEQAEATQRNMPPGTPVTAYYNPAAPADYRMHPGISSGEIMWIVGAIFVSIVAIVATCFGLVARSRATAYKDQIDGITMPPAFGYP